MSASNFKYVYLSCTQDSNGIPTAAYLLLYNGYLFTSDYHQNNTRGMCVAFSVRVAISKVVLN